MAILCCVAKNSLRGTVSQWHRERRKRDQERKCCRRWIIAVAGCTTCLSAAILYLGGRWTSACPPSPPPDLDPLRAAMGARGMTVSVADRYDQAGWYGALCACVSKALHAHSHLATAYRGINTFWET
jgi:hypothetical protein